MPGPRLLARNAASIGCCCCARSSSWRAQARLSSAHLLFLDDDDQAAAREAGLVAAHAPCSSTGATARPTPYADFADFLASLQRDKRKKIQQERRRVADAGVTFTVATGDRRSPTADWDFFYRCYALTYRAHHSTPYLTRDFFARMAATMADNWLLFIAWRDGKRDRQHR